METNAPESLYRQSRLQIIFAVTLTGVMAVSLLSPAFGSIKSHFGISGGEVGLVIAAFTLPGILLSVLIGAIADKFGRKKVIVPSLFLFGLAGGSCAFVSDFSHLVILRFFQGIGGTGLVVLATTLIGDYYDGLERAEAMGLNASVLSIGTASYPFIGGFLAEISWRAPFLLFFVAIPVGLTALFYLDVPDVEATEIRKYMEKLKDIATSIKSLGGMAAGVLAFIFLYGGVITYIPLLLSSNFGAQPSQVGFFVGFMSVIVAIVSSQAEKLVERFSKIPTIVGGFMSYGVALVLIPFVPRLELFVFVVALFGLGHGMTMPNLQTFFSELAPKDYRGATMSLYNMSARIGMTIGPPLLAIAFSFGGYLWVYLTVGFVGISASVIGKVGTELV